MAITEHSSHSSVHIHTPAQQHVPKRRRADIPVGSRPSTTHIPETTSQPSHDDSPNNILNRRKRHALDHTRPRPRNGRKQRRVLWDDLGTPQDILKGNLLLLIARARNHVAIVAIERAERVAKGGKVDKVVLVLGLALVTSVKVWQARQPEGEERVRGEEEEAESGVDQEWGDE